MKRFFLSLIVILGTLFSSTAVFATDTYTSVIVDCTHLDLKRAMSPIIKDEHGEEIYPDGITNSASKHLLEGVIFYKGSMEEAFKSKKAGENPMIVKAVSVSGSFASNPVISRLDAVRMILADGNGHFFSKHNVFIVYNKK